MAAVFITADTVGLAVFSTTDAQIGMASQPNLFGVIPLAFVTAAGDGTACDILVSDVSMILRTDLYGSVATLIGGLICLFGRLGWINIFTLNLFFAGGLLFRLTIYRFHWQPPGFQRHGK